MATTLMSLKIAEQHARIVEEQGLEPPGLWQEKEGYSVSSSPGLWITYTVSASGRRIAYD
jgi:hypothetical protein